MASLAALAALLFSGVVQAAISPPWNVVALHPIAWVPALYVFSRLNGRRALAAGWLVGASANLVIFDWLPGTISRFGELPMWFALFVWVLFALAMGFYAALFALAFGRVRRAAGTYWPFAVAVLFCALEFLNPQIFGYVQGDAWYQVPRVFLLSAATGAAGVSFLVLVCNALVLEALEWLRGAGGGRALARNAGVFAAALVVAVSYSSLRLARIRAAEEAAPALRVALVQPNRTIERRRELARMRGNAFAEDLLALSREASAKEERPIDVYVWPEGALPSDPALPRNAAVREFVRASRAEVWTGANQTENDGHRMTTQHNSAFRIFADGQVDRRYDKNILVPFGEYVPLRGVVPGFDRIRTAGNYEAGEDVPILVSGPARFVFVICYEAIRSGFVRRAIGEDANLIVNVTVDAWYGDSSEQSQHLMLAAAQSAMNGLPLVRSTTTGISAFVDAAGLITDQTGKFTRESLVRDVRPVRVAGPYSRWGDWFAWLCVAASAMLLVAGAERGSRTAVVAGTNDA